MIPEWPTLSVWEIYLVGCAFILGAVVGSFLNVVIARVPEGASIVHPGSRCPQCGSGIRWYDNIPVVSYLILRARCRDCGLSISARYPLVELLTGLLSAALMLRYDLTVEFAVFFVMTCMLVAVCFIDLDHMIIPDVISIPGLFIGLAASTAGWIPDMDWKTSLLGVIVGGLTLWIPGVLYELIRKTEGMGGGDVKLLAMIGAFTGPFGALMTLGIGSVIGSAIAVTAMLLHRMRSQNLIPFGPFLVVGCVAYLLLNDLMWAWLTQPGFE